MPRSRRIGLDLLAELTDIDPEILWIDRFVAPDLAQQMLVGQHLAGVDHELLQDVVLLGFSWEGNTLVRTNNNHAAEMGAGMGGEPGDSTDMTTMLQSMHYKYSFAFANEVSDLHIADGMVRDTAAAKELKLSTDWSVISKDPKALDLRITLKK